LIAMMVEKFPSLDKRVFAMAANEDPNIAPSLHNDKSMTVEAESTDRLEDPVLAQVIPIRDRPLSMKTTSDHNIFHSKTIQIFDLAYGPLARDQFRDSLLCLFLGASLFQGRPLHF